MELCENRRFPVGGQMVTAVATSRYLPFLDPTEESTLLANGAVKMFAREQMIFDQNVPMRAIFFIEDGSVRVERKDRGAIVPLTTLGAGEFFGEMSFVDGAPTSARMVAEEPSRLRIIDAATVEDMARTDPHFAARFYHSIAAILADRLRLSSMRYLDQSLG
jgi:CRP/FNR family transcriptional regulator, cyclic AMP receptor protein